MNKFIDRGNVDRLIKLNRLTFSQFKNELFNDVDTTFLKKDGKYDPIETQFNNMKSVTKLLLQNNGKSQRNYKFSKGNNEGRKFVEFAGVQRLNGKLRGLICNDLYFDFDMVNAHPSILLDYCIKNNINSHCLKDYVTNRDEKITELINETQLTKSEVKVLFLKSMNSCYNVIDYKNKNKRVVKIKSSFFIQLDTEFKNIQNEVLKLNDDIKNKVESKGNSNNLNGKVINHLLCRLENQYLMKAINELYDNDFITSKNDLIPMFDGFMIHNKNLTKSAHETKEYLISVFNDESIKWSIKHHNLELVDNFNNIELSDDNILTGIFDNLVEVGDYLTSSILTDKLFVCDYVTLLIKDNLIVENKSQIDKDLFTIIKKQDLHINLKNDIVKVSSSVHYINDVKTVILANAPTNNQIIEKVWDNTRFKLCFENGYYDFNKKLFVENYNDLVTPFIIQKKFNPVSNPELRKQILKKVFYPIFTIQDKEKDKVQHDLFEYIMHTIARCLAGHIEDKRWFMFQGERDCGKGIICDFLKNTFEKYIGITNASNFEVKRGDEDAKSNSWIVDFQFRRICFSQELKEGSKMNGAKIKKFCSGGDLIEARKNFKDEINFKTQSAYILLANDEPIITPSDTYEKCTQVYMNSKFIDEKTYRNKRNKNIKYYAKDDSVKTDFIKNPDIMNEFILLLIDYYYKDNLQYPVELLKENEDVGNNENEDRDKILGLFVFSNSYKVKYSEIKKLLKEKEITITFRKAVGFLTGDPDGNVKKGRSGTDRFLLNLRVRNPEDEMMTDNNNEQSNFSF